MESGELDLQVWKMQIPWLHLLHHLFTIVDSSWRFLVKSSGKLILLLCRSSMLVINVPFVVLKVILHKFWLKMILGKVRSNKGFGQIGDFGNICFWKMNPSI